MKIEVEIGDITPPEGCVTATLRHPKCGEMYIGHRTGKIHRCEARDGIDLLAIVFEAYKFPDFIKPGWWIAMNAGGEWWAFPSEPIIPTDSCVRPNRAMVYEYGISLAPFNWTPPQCPTWHTSKMQKPME